MDGKRIQQVQRFTYLGSIVTEDGYTLADVKSRIALAKKKFMERREILSGEMGIEMKKKLVKCLIWSVATFGAETWIMNAETRRRIESFEMWCWRRMLKVKWTEKRSNEWVLEQVGEMWTLLKAIERRKKQWLGHVMRHNGMMREVVEGKMKGKKGKGRPRLGLWEQNYEEVKRLAENRNNW